MEAKLQAVYVFEGGLVCEPEVPSVVHEGIQEEQASVVGERKAGASRGGKPKFPLTRNCECGVQYTAKNHYEKTYGCRHCRALMKQIGVPSSHLGPTRCGFKERDRTQEYEYKLSRWVEEGFQSFKKARRMADRTYNFNPEIGRDPGGVL